MDKGLDIVGVRAALAWHAAVSGHPRHLAAASRYLRLNPPADPGRLAAILAASCRHNQLTPHWDSADRSVAWCVGERRAIVPYGDARYPPLLREIPTPPPLLFVDGDLEALAAAQFAIVGSRKATRGACDTATRIAAELAARGAVITSGLALGIDQAAHRGALGAGGRTVAVLGCGIDRVYPHRHRTLAAEIRGAGALVSEFPLGAPPMARHFPQRNRIIAGLCLGTLVVEAASRSGSISTAMHALEQGREVFAVPGSINNPLSAGCHSLLRQGARLTVASEDIIEELPQLASRVAVSAPAARPITDAADGLETGPKRLLDACAWEPNSVDELVQRSGLTVQEVSSMLLPLELAGLIESRANGTYVRIR